MASAVEEHLGLTLYEVARGSEAVTQRPGDSGISPFAAVAGDFPIDPDPTRHHLPSEPSAFLVLSDWQS